MKQEKFNEFSVYYFNLRPFSFNNNVNALSFEYKFIFVTVKLQIISELWYYY